MNIEERRKVIRLRSKGLTYSEISNALGKRIPKSTLSYWGRQIVLSSEQIDRINILNKRNLIKAREAACIAKRNIRQNYLDDLRARNSYLVKCLDSDVMKISLAMLYLGEGSKWRSSRYLGLGNADPDVIKLYLKLLRACYRIDETKLKCRIGYRADQEIDELEKFWSQLTKIPINQFYNTKPDPRTIGKVTKRKDYKGVCVVFYFDTAIQLELECIAKLISEGP